MWEGWNMKLVCEYEPSELTMRESIHLRILKTFVPTEELWTSLPVHTRAEWCFRKAESHTDRITKIHALPCNNAINNFGQNLWILLFCYIIKVLQMCWRTKHHLKVGLGRNQMYQIWRSLEVRVCFVLTPDHLQILFYKDSGIDDTQRNVVKG